MSISYKKTVAVLDGHCEIDEAETLLEWLLENPKGKLNLKSLEHPHTALLQVMMALKPMISSWPEEQQISSWIEPLLDNQQ